MSSIRTRDIRAESEWVKLPVTRHRVGQKRTKFPKRALIRWSGHTLSLLSANDISAYSPQPDFVSHESFATSWVQLLPVFLHLI